MKPTLELTGVLFDFAANLRLWSDVIGADASLRGSGDARDAQARLGTLAAAASDAARRLAGMEAIEAGALNILLSYADGAEGIGERLPEGPHRSALRSLAAQLRSGVHRCAPARAYV